VDSRSHNQAIDKLVDRYRLEENKQRERREQKEQDERAQRRSDDPGES
jgi:flagellar biosynthesis chaperone FliJ